MNGTTTSASPSDDPSARPMLPPRPNINPPKPVHQARARETSPYRHQAPPEYKQPSSYSKTWSANLDPRFYFPNHPAPREAIYKRSAYDCNPKLRCTDRGGRDYVQEELTAEEHGFTAHESSRLVKGMPGHCVRCQHSFLLENSEISEFERLKSEHLKSKNSKVHAGGNCCYGGPGSGPDGFGCDANCCDGCDASVCLVCCFCCG